MLLKDVAKAKNMGSGIKTRAVDCLKRIHHEEVSPSNDDATDELYIPYRNSFVEMLNKSIKIKTEHWKCTYCNHINTLIPESLRAVNSQHRALVSTCKGCDNRFIIEA